ncbi:MAG: hypothetical protein KDB27_32245 [Planctomycetales bacterium]|nr:hypothetical protein [Planctomycetales bacterium]
MHSVDSIPNGRPRDPLRDALAQAVKELVWRYLIRFEPRRSPICLYGSRRSGSTLLMEVIGVNPKVMFSDQPFSVYTATRANVNQLPIFSYGQSACPDSEEEEILARYIERLFSGQTRANIPWKVWSPEFHFRNDRVCLKITDAKSLIEWIDSRFDVSTVVLTRHPIAQALSVANVGWMTTGKGLLRNSKFVEQWLDGDQEAFCWERYNNGSDLERRVTDWALENIPILSRLKANPHWLFIAYEDLVQYPDRVVTVLSDKLDLPDRKRMIERVSRPSRSAKRLSTDERQRLIQRGDPAKLLNSWRSKISEEEIRNCFRVLDRLHIDLYRVDDPVPDHRRVGRDGFA